MFLVIKNRLLKNDITAGKNIPKCCFSSFFSKNKKIIIIKCYEVWIVFLTSKQEKAIYSDKIFAMPMPKKSFSYTAKPYNQLIIPHKCVEMSWQIFLEDLKRPVTPVKFNETFAGSKEEIEGALMRYHESC